MASCAYLSTDNWKATCTCGWWTIARRFFRRIAAGWPQDRKKSPRFNENFSYVNLNIEKEETRLFHFFILFNLCSLLSLYLWLWRVQFHRFVLWWNFLEIGLNVLTHRNIVFYAAASFILLSNAVFCVAATLYSLICMICLRTRTIFSIKLFSNNKNKVAFFCTHKKVSNVFFN